MEPQPLTAGERTTLPSGSPRRPRSQHRESGSLRRKRLVGVPAVLFDHGVEKLSGLGGAYGLDGHGGNGSEEFRDLLGIGDFGIVIVCVGIDQSKHDTRLQS